MENMRFSYIPAVLAATLCGGDAQTQIQMKQETPKAQANPNRNIFEAAALAPPELSSITATIPHFVRKAADCVLSKIEGRPSARISFQNNHAQYTVDLRNGRSLAFTRRRSRGHILHVLDMDMDGRVDRGYSEEKGTPVFDRYQRTHHFSPGAERAFVMYWQAVYGTAIRDTVKLCGNPRIRKNKRFPPLGGN